MTLISQMKKRLFPNENDAYCILYTSSFDEILVDLIDYIKASKCNWYLDKTGRVYTKNGFKTIFLSRFLLEPKLNEIVDHINGNTKDNRRYNLRITDALGNARNHGLNKNNTSGYKGVSLDKSKNLYRAYITVNWKHISLGHFKKATDAALAYNKAAIKYFGEFARINVINN